MSIHPNLTPKTCFTLPTQSKLVVKTCRSTMVHSQTTELLIGLLIIREDDKIDRREVIFHFLEGGVSSNGRRIDLPFGSPICFSHVPIFPRHVFLLPLTRIYFAHPSRFLTEFRQSPFSNASPVTLQVS